MKYLKDKDSFLLRDHVRATFTQVFDLAWFPFDQQTLNIKMTLDIANKYCMFDPSQIVITRDAAHCTELEGSEV